MDQGPHQIQYSQSMVELMNLYTNYKSTGIWDTQRKDSTSTIIALATALKKYQANNSACKKSPGTTSSKPNGLAKWRFKHTRKDKFYPKGNKSVWCKKHGCK